MTIPPTVLANARLVLPEGVIRGALSLEDGVIAAITPGDDVPPGATDLQGDFLAPGMVELHTDNLERHLRPRPGVDWPHASAILAHDAELAGCGITTVFDAMRVGSIPGDGPDQDYDKYARPLAQQGLEAIERAECDQRYVPPRSRKVKVNTLLDGLSSRPMLLPVWIMAYRYKGSLFRVLINGSTGKLHGKRPISYTKIFAIAGAIAALLLLILLCTGALTALV